MARPRKQPKAAEQTEGLARKIWLAGLGAYGKRVEDAYGHIDKASQEASKFFNDLVQKGQAIEGQSRSAIRSRISEARDRIEEARSRVTGLTAGNPRTVDDLIGRVREKMGLDASVNAKLEALSRRVDSLAHAVDDLVNGKQKPAPKRRRAPPRKPRD